MGSFHMPVGHGRCPGLPQRHTAVETAQGLEVALSFLVLNEIICFHANDTKSVSMTATTDPMPYFPNLPVNLSKS